MNRQTRHLETEEHQETRELVKSAFSLARSLGIKRLVVQADEISDMRLVETLRDDERVIWVARDWKQIPVSDPSKDVVLAMPDAALNRLSQLNLALFLAALNHHLEPDERVLGLSGVAGSQSPRFFARRSADAKIVFETDSCFSIRRWSAYWRPSARHSRRNSSSATGEAGS